MLLYLNQLKGLSAYSVGSVYFAVNGKIAFEVYFAINDAVGFLNAILC